MKPEHRPDRFTLLVARERGRQGFTFTTDAERQTPGYDEAYRLGQLDALIAAAAEAEDTRDADDLELSARREQDLATGPFRNS